MSVIESRLKNLAVLAERSERVDGRIRDAAKDRLSAVNDRIENLKATVALHGDSEYLELVKERGYLERVVARSGSPR